MRYAAFTVILAGACFGQALTELGAAAGVGTVAGANGQNVAKGLTTVFGKINEQTAKAAGKGEATPVLEVSAGQPKPDPSGVPLPPVSPGRRVAPPAALPVIAQITAPAEVTEMRTISDVAPTLPPPPEMSPEKLKAISSGMSRAELLRLGAPNSKITMDEGGHAVEIYSYRDKGQKIGTVRLDNGAVATVEY